MLKKIISVILSFMIVFSVTGAMAAETSSPYENAVNLLEKLNILYEKNSAVYDSAVSRADFAVYAARVLGIDDTIRDKDTRYFIDMAMYDYAAYSVNCLVERGILSVGDNRMFRPADPITYAEAVKIAVCMLGYKPAAEARGGYPSGYVTIASQLDLIDNNQDDVFSLNDVAELLYHTLTAPQYVIDSIKTDGSDNTYSYTSSDDHTLLYDNFGYKFLEGILTGYDDINIAFDVTASEGQAVVEGTRFKVNDGIDMIELIGSNVCVLYDEDDVIHIAYAEEANEKIVEFDTYDYVSYNGSTLVYYDEDKGNKSLDVAGAVVLYNGAAPATGTQELFDNLESGSVKVIDSDGKSGYDAGVVNDYHAYVYKSADVNNNIIFSKIDNQSSIELDKYERIEMISSNGEPVDITALESNDVLNVLAAKDYSRIKIIVTKDKVSGIVSQIEAGDKLNVEIEGKFYTINKAYQSLENDIKLGQKLTLLLNIYGEAVMIADSSYDGMNVGFLSGLSFGDNAFNNDLKFRIYSKASGLAVYSSADSIKIDGIRYTDSVAAAKSIPDTTVSGDKIAFKSQIVLFKLNSDNEITAIDTHYVSSEENADNSLVRVADGTKYLTKYSGRFDKTLPVNSTTQVFCVPEEDSLSSDASDYFIAKESNFNNTVQFKMEAYKVKGTNEIVDAMIYHVNPNDTAENDWLNSKMLIVGRVSDAVDKDDEHYKLIKGLMQGNERQLEIYAEELNSDSDPVAEISEGDLIRFRTAQNGRVIHLQKLYDASSEARTAHWKGDNDTTSLFDAGFNSNFQLSFGYVNKTGDRTLSWGYKSGADVDEVLDLSAMKCMYYDKNLPSGKRLYTAGFDAIVDYESAGDNCDVIILQTLQTNPQALVVYKK